MQRGVPVIQETGTWTRGPVTGYSGVQLATRGTYKAIITTIELGTIPEALAISAEEDFLFVADYSAPRLAVISLASCENSPNRAG